MRARLATVNDLEAVFGDLSQRMADEYQSSGMGIEEAKDALVTDLEEGRAYTLVNGERPLAIIAWHEDGDVAHTLFAAREGFFTAATVRFCKKHIRRIQSLCGGLPLRHRSWLARPDVSRWFRIIGFAEKEKGLGWTVFELSANQ